MPNIYQNLIVNAEIDKLSAFFKKSNVTFISSGKLECKEKKKIKNLTLPYYRIAYFHCGTVEYFYSGHTLTLCKGDILLTRPNQLYKVNIKDTKTVFSFIYFTFDTPYLESEFLKLFNYTENPIVHRCLSSDTQNIFNHVLYEYINQHCGYYTLCENMLKSLLICIIRNVHERLPENKFLSKECSTHDRLISAATAFIHTRIYERLSIEDVSRQMHVSSNYLYKAFVSSLSISPQQYIIECKISQAKQLLTVTDSSICEVAYKLQFSSSQHFSQTFKRITGETPSSFRNSMNNNEESHT